MHSYIYLKFSKSKTTVYSSISIEKQVPMCYNYCMYFGIKGHILF